MNQQMQQALDWNPATILQSPLFAPLYPAIVRLGISGFPTLNDCNALLDSRPSPITVQSGLPLRFVAQQPGKQPFAAQYEPRCYLAGEVQMREHNWHDLFNALVWLTFPTAKALLNARHYRAMLEERHVLLEQPALGNKGRGTLRDANTLFDESGVIVAYSDACTGADLAGLLRGFQWKKLFWQQREQVRPQSSQKAMGFYLFGHGLYEKALQPYIGMTGQGLLLAVQPKFFSWPQLQQLAHLDNLLADYLAAPEHCRSTRDLSPVPLLGVPGWAADNDNAAYYDNAAYFRPGRRG